MALPLVHLKGHSGVPSLGARVHPAQPGHIIYVSGCQLVVQDEEDRRRQQFLKQHSEPITAFGLSHTGQFAATAQGGHDSDVLLWDLIAGQPYARFSEHDHRVLSLSYSLDDKLLLSVGCERDQRLFVLDTSNGKIVTKSILQYGKKVTASAFAPSPGDVYNFATAFGSELVLWTLNPFNGMLSSRTVVTGSVRRTFNTLVYSADGQWLYAGTTTGDIVTVNALRAAIQLTHPACSNGVGAMVLSSSGRLLVGGGDGTITLFSNDHMWRDMRPFVTLPGSIVSLSPSHDGAYLLAGTTDGSLYRISCGVFNVSAISQGPSGPVTGLATSAFHPDLYVSASMDGRINIHSMHQDHSLAQVVQAEPTAGAPLAIALAGDQIVSGWEDGSLRSSYLAQGSLDHTGRQDAKSKSSVAWTIPGAHTSAGAVGTTALAVAQRGHLMASGGAGGELRVWSMETRFMLGHLKLHACRINQVSILSDDVHLVAACEDHSLSAWDMNTQKCRATWRLPVPIRSVAPCADQFTLMSVGHDRNVTLWDLRVPDPVHTIPGAHDNIINAIATTPGSSLFATGGGDCTVKLWDLRGTGQPVGCAYLAAGVAHTGSVGSLAFHPTGCLLSGGADGCVGIWQP